MIELSGKYGTAKVFTDNIEEKATSQIINLMNQAFIEGSQVRIMPDVHAGAGSTIGTTMTIKDKVVPNLVGVDIACGMETAMLNDSEIDLDHLDSIIHKHIPSGFNTRKSINREIADKIPLYSLICLKHVNLERAKLSIGTLGGGNHFIELGRNDKGSLFLVVHSGSRNLGKQIAEYYQAAAEKRLSAKPIKVDKNLAYCEGTLLDDYLHDVNIAQQYATLNRKIIINEIVENAGLKVVSSFTTMHNYIDLDNMILRKGAISAQKGERVLIPINMRDGSILAYGKGNPDWNYSAPHGAGRTMSRSVAKREISMGTFKLSMEGVYSTTVNESTLDEAPQAYKPMDEIIDNIGDTVEIESIIKPLYNFKAAQ